MLSYSEELTILIDQMPVIDREAEAIQAVDKSQWKSIDPQRAERIREIYLEWFNKCLHFFSDQGRIAFFEPYSGRGNYNIRTFLKEPNVASYHSGSSSAFTGSRSAGWSWHTNYHMYFKDQFNSQKLLLTELRAAYKQQESLPPPPPPPPAIDVIRLHPRIKAVSTELFKNGHYRQAIFQACLALNEAVQQRSGRDDLDGSKLMQQVFSPNSPVLAFSGHPDEQIGYMWLFSGVSMAIRNPRAHKLGEAEDQDANEAIEVLAMISSLYRALDAANKV